MVMPGAVSKERLDSLTGLRFIAVLFVYLSHHPGPDFLPTWLDTFFISGYNGVTIFFVLSGFVIALNYFESIASPRALLQYLVARFARIYPLYLLVLLYVWFELGMPQDSNFVLHVLAIQTWSPDIRVAYGYNGPGWSIGIEFFFYACFPLIVLVLARLRHRTGWLWSLAIGITVALFLAALFFLLTDRAGLPWEDPESAHRWLYRDPVPRLGDFTLGVIAALLYKQFGAANPGTRRVWAGITYGALVAMLLLMTWHEHVNSAFSWDASYAPLAFLIILGLAVSPTILLSRVLASRPAIVLGEASFALYLVHTKMISIFRIDRYASRGPLGAIFLFLAFFGICLALSISLNKYIESPARRIINDRVGRLLRIHENG